MNNVEDTIQSIKTKGVQEFKKVIFDIITAAIVIAIIVAALDVFEIVDFESMTVYEFIISWIPYFLASTLLNLNQYKKGSFVGKCSAKFKEIASLYSSTAGNLKGNQIDKLQEFCDNYNDKALENIQTIILKKEGITFNDFANDFVKNDKQYLSLKTRTKKQLIEYGYNKEQIKVIKKAKRASVKGINVNLLMSNINTIDPTNIGIGERELENRHTITGMFTYIIVTVLMSLLGLKDVTQWGWTGLLLVVFKVSYMTASSFMSYFNGYDDITINLANHITRKYDILKQYLDINITKGNNTL